MSEQVKEYQTIAQPEPVAPHTTTRIVQPYMTVKEAAEALDLTTGAVYLALNSGRLKWHYEGSQKAIWVRDVEAFPISPQAEAKRRIKIAARNARAEKENKAA